MWVLTLINKDSKEEYYYLTSRKPEYFVGRAHADITLTGDSSISRKHTSLYIANREKCPFNVKTHTGLWVKDHGSKYGTYVREGQDWSKIDPNVNVLISHGAHIRFGIVCNIWRVEYQPFVICTSTISDDTAVQLKEILTTLDGAIISQFNPKCSAVVTPSITLSLKVLLGLINGVPLVTPAYVNEISNATANRSKWPNPKLFLPPLGESSVKKSDANFNHEQDRKTLFSGKTFYVGKPVQLETLKIIVESAGGKISLLSSDNRKEIMADGAVLLEPRQSSSQSQSQSQWDSAVIGLLEKNGRRTVPEREIPLAIVYSSVAKHCNPTFLDFSPRLDPANSQTPSVLNSSILVEGTEPSPMMRSSANGVVEASLTPVPTTHDPSSEPARSVIHVEKVGPTRIHIATGTTQASARDRATDCSYPPVPSTSRQPISALPIENESRPSTANSLPMKEVSVSSASSKFAMLARKRSGSTDIEEAPSAKRLFNDASSSTTKTTSKSSWLNDPFNNTPSSIPVRETRVKICENPFGANLVSSTPLSAGKRQHEDSEEVSFQQPEKRKRTQETPIQRRRLQEVTPVLSRPDLIPREPPKPAPAPPKPPVNVNKCGFIDMSFKKELPDNDLGTTIIMMSMIKVDRWNVRSNSAMVEDDTSDAKNVKTFKKWSKNLFYVSGDLFIYHFALRSSRAVLRTGSSKNGTPLRQIVLSGNRPIPMESLEEPTPLSNWTASAT